METCILRAIINHGGAGMNAHHQKSESAAHAQFESVRESFRAWRATKKTANTTIPVELWQKAVSLTAHFSLSRIAKALSLDFVKLKTFSLHVASQQPIKTAAQSLSCQGIGAISLSEPDENRDDEPKHSTPVMAHCHTPDVQTSTLKPAEKSGFIEIALSPFSSPPPLVAELIMPGGQVLKFFTGLSTDLLKAALQR